MIVLSVMTTIPSKSGFVWWPVEFPQNSIDEVFEQLDRAGCAQALKLEGDHRPSGAIYVTRKTPVVIGANGIVTITQLHKPVIDQTEERGSGVDRDATRETYSPARLGDR